MHSTVVTSVAYRSSSLGGSDAFIAKFSGAGTMVWCAQIGGSSDEFGYGIGVDAAGNSYITGTTYSSSFPTVNAIDASYNGGGDAFVTELNAFGTALIYSSFLGGTGADEGRSIAVTPSGRIYVAGSARANDFPTTPGAFAPTMPNLYYSLGFITAFTPGTSWATDYSTYLGGNTELWAIAVNGLGQVFATGYTDSSAFPTTPGALRPSPTYYSGLDSFLAQLSADGTVLLYASLLGGSETSDSGNAITLDGKGGVYIAGTSLYGPGFPTTPAAISPRVPKPFLAA